MHDRQTLESIFLANLGAIDRIVAALCRRHGLGHDDADDFASWAKLALVADDYAVLRKFRGESALTTYLTVVLAMLLRDYRAHHWGRWRPSAAALRGGALAVRLETLVRRDGMRLEEAGELLRTRGETDRPDRELAKILAALPDRPPLRPVAVGEDSIEETPARATADELVSAREASAERGAADAALRAALTRLPPEDQLIIRMHYWEGLGVADIARGLGLAQKPLYRRIERDLAQLRTWLEAAGVSRDRARALLAEPVP